MPIFEVNGQQYDVDEQYINDFAKENPKAVTRVNQGESLLEISASDYPSYLSQTKQPIKEVPGASVPSYQTKPEDVGFENVLDKKSFEQRYNVNPNVLSGRQTDPIQKGIESLREKVGKKSNIPQYPLGNRYTYGFGSDYANKEADKQVTAQVDASIENELRGAEKSYERGGFWSSVGSGLKNEKIYLDPFGTTGFDNDITLLHVAKKAEKEGFDKLPEREQDLLTASALRIAAEAANSDEKTAMQIAGMSTAESIPYMLQFMLTSNPASMVTSPVRSAIKKAAEKAIKSGVSSKLAGVIKGAARTASVATKAGVMSAIQPTMYADAVSRGTGKATIDENGKYAGMEDAENAPVAAYKAFANATVENLSEHSGTMLSGATGAAARALKKVPALGGFISNVQKNNVLSGATKMMKAVGFNGAPEEFFEEQVSTGLNSLIVGDSQFSDFTNWKQQLATLISVGATAGAMTSTGSLMSVPYKKQIKNNYSEATDLVKGYFSPDEFDQFRASLSNMNIDSRPDFISSVAEAKGFSTDEVKDLTVFATRQAQYDGYVGSVIDKIEDGKIKAQNELDRISNKSMGEILEIKMDNRPTNIVGGFVVFNENGTINNKRSSQVIYYLDEDGKRKMSSPDKFGELVRRQPLSEAYAEVFSPIEDDILIKEENDLAEPESQEKAQKKADLLTENDNLVETPEGVGAISHVEPDENSAIVVFPDGRSKRFALPALKPAPVAQDVAPEVQQAAPSEEVLGVQPETPTQAAPVFPVDKENNIDYSQIQEPEMYAQALQSEFEGDAVSVIEEQIQSAQSRLEKAGKNSDAIKRRRAMKSEQAEVDRLNKAKAILSQNEQIVNEMPLENIGNEEALPGEESNMIDLSQLTEPELRKYIAENSTDPIELADLYDKVKEETEYSQRVAQQPVLEKTETEAESKRGNEEGIEPTPEEISEIELQLETPKRKDVDTEEVPAENELFYRSSHNHFQIAIAENEVISLSESFNTPIKLVETVNEITNEDKRKEKRMRSAKGWYEPKTGEVVIVLQNAESVGDVQATILHEIVGHKGLRGLLGDKFEEMMDKVYKHLPKATRKKIMESAVNKYRFDYRTATEEYLAEFVEKDVMEPSIWQKIKSAIKSFFRDLGVNLEMNDADIAYLLWKSKNRLLKGDGAIEAINKVAKGEEAKERFREAAYTDADVLSDELDKSARDAWERLSKDQRSVHEIVNETAEVRKGILKYVPTNENVKKSIYELTQGWFDNAVSLRILQHLVNTVSDQPIESFANPYQFLTTIPARNENKMNTFVKTKFSKIGQAIKELGVPRSTVQIYAYLKHGLERNEYMRAQDVREKGEKLKEASDLRIQAISDSIEAMNRQLETADKKGTNRILAKIEGYNLAIEGIKAELESKKQEYEKSVSLKDYSGVYAVADLFIKKSDDREFTVAQIETAIEEFEKEHDVTKLWEAINGATKWTVQNEFEMGRISKDLRDKLFSMYKYYIPLKGWEEKNANEEWDYISGGGVPVSPIKKAGGRKSLASNLLENIGLAAQTSVMGGHKNLLKLHALRMVRNYPNPMYRVSEVWAVKEGDEWVQKAPEYSEDPEVYADNVVKFEEEMKELKDLGLANKLGGKLNVGSPITKYEAKEHEILVYENGKPYVIYINGNPDIARAINLTSKKPYEIGGADATGKNTLKRAVNQTMRLMRFSGQNITSRNPAFIAVNLMLDTQWAILAGTAKEGTAYAKKMSGNFISPSIHRSIMRGVRGKLDESNPIDKLFGEFQRAGGETGYSDLFKVEDFEKMIKDELKDGADWRKAYTWYTGPIDTLNRWAELTSRFSAYVTSRNSGRDVERSAYDAKEITLNFNRSGTGAFLGNWLKFAYLFAGAGLQGAYSISNLLLSKRSRKRITMIFAGTAMLGFLVPLINDLFLGGDDDDDLYSKKPDYERKSNILIRIKGTNSFIKLPIAQSLRPFYNIGESMYQIVKGNRNAGEGTMDIVGGFGMLLPFDPFGGSSLMMSAFQPAYQIKENKDFFGRKIFKDDSFTQYDPEFKRAFSNTSPAFVELTRTLNDITGGDEVTKGWLNLNPGILEHLTEGYLGGAFKFVNDIGKQVNGAHEVYKGNPYPYDSRSYPIIGRFYTNTAATSDINAEYYKYVNDAEEISHRVKKYQELGKKGDEEALDKSIDLMISPEYKKATIVNLYRRKIDEMNKMVKASEMGENEASTFREQIKELKEDMFNEIEKIK